MHVKTLCMMSSVAFKGYSSVTSAGLSRDELLFHSFHSCYIAFINNGMLPHTTKKKICVEVKEYYPLRRNSRFSVQIFALGEIFSIHADASVPQLTAP